jgi:hypothetical protein
MYPEESKVLAVVAAVQLQNWAMVLQSAILRKWRKSQADVDSDAVLAFPFVGDARAALGVVVFLFEDFF